MSALLPLITGRIDLSAEYGDFARTFRHIVRVVQCPDYESCLLLVHTSPLPLKNRIQDYKNHFTMYKTNDRIVLVMAEMGIKYPDNDAVVVYHVIKPIPGCSFRATYSDANWVVSFDRIEYSGFKPDISLMRETELVCKGEWWLFECGYALSGIAAYPGDVSRPADSMFMYLEMHPRTGKDFTFRMNPTVPVVPEPETEFIQEISGDRVAVERADRENGDGRRSVPFQTTIPSNAWFHSRDIELSKGDISYFITSNVTSISGGVIYRNTVYTANNPDTGFANEKPVLRPIPRLSSFEYTV